MFRCFSRCCVLIAVATMVASCGPKLPQVRVWRPWYRTIQGAVVRPNATVETVVNGNSDQLLGDQDLLHREVKRQFDKLLERRGFRVVDADPEYNVNLTYSITRHDKLDIEARASAQGTQLLETFSGIGTAASSVLGISIARTVAATTGIQSVGANASVDIKQQEGYTHAFSVEFFGTDGIPAWKGESSWDSREIDVTAAIRAPLLLALSGLPDDSTYLPVVPAVKESHGFNYYRENCVEKWLSCPALPFLIGFPSTASEYSPTGWPAVSYRKGERLPTDIKNTEALEAYVDLVSTAENALPTGLKKWKDPTDLRLWKKAQLGGRYRLGQDGQVVQILIELSGTEAGYTVRKAYVATDTQYAVFEADLSHWKQALKDYYDFYEK